MRRRFSALLVSFIFTAIVSTAFCQDHDAIMAIMAEKRDQHTLDVMTKNLALTSEQQIAVKASLDDQRKKTADLQKEFADKQKALQDETEKQMLSNLTDDQKEKYPGVKEQLQKEQEQSLGNMSGANGAQSGHGHRHGGY